MTRRQINALATKATLAVAIAGALIWGSGVLAREKPAKPCPLSPTGQHDYMVGGDGVWLCWYCECVKPK